MQRPFFTMYSLIGLTTSVCFALIFSSTVHANPDTDTQASVSSKPIKVIFFDVNETLLDLESMRNSVGSALGGRPDLLPLWFSTMLHYSLVDSATGRYHHFGEIGVAALLMVAEMNDIDLSPEKAHQAIVTPLQSLPPHPDVKASLKKLKQAGFTLVSLTNSSNRGVKTQFQHAGLLDLFDRRLSVEDIQVYKPHLEAYQWAATQMGIQPGEALMVAAHGWDTAGAKAAGMQTAFLQRPGKVIYPLALPADYVAEDLAALTEQLTAKATTGTSSRKSKVSAAIFPH